MKYLKPTIYIALFLASLAVVNHAQAGTKYWHGGTGNWSDAANHWSENSGNSPSAATSTPTANDNVIFDSASNATAYTVTVDATANCKDMTWALPGTSGVPTLAGSSALNIYGSLTNVATMNWTYNGSVYFKATSMGNTIISAGVSIASWVIFNGLGGGWQLQDAFTSTSYSPSIELINGTLDTDGKTVALSGSFYRSSGTNTLTLGASNLSILTGGAAVNIGSGGSFTITANTALITLIGPDASFGGSGSFDYNGATLIFTGYGVANIRTANTFKEIRRIGTATRKDDALVLYADQTVTDLTLTGYNTAPYRLLVQSDTIGTSRTITAANVSITNTDFQDITAAGAGDWDLSAISGGSGNAGGNTGITFTPAATQYFKAGTSQNWSTAGNWYLETNGGGGAGRVPLLQDTAIFDSNSITAGGVTITQDMPRIGSVDWTGVTNSPTWTMSGSTYVFGSIALSSGMTFGAGTVYFQGRGNNTLTSAGKTWPNGITIDVVTGKLTLMDALSNASYGNILTITSGTFDAGNQNVTYRRVDSSNSNARSIIMGSGTWTLTMWDPWYMANTANLTFDAGASTIKLTDATSNAKTFDGGGLTYNSIWFSGAGTGEFDITGSNTFNDFKVDTPPHSIKFASGTVTTVNTFTVSGTAGNLVTLDTIGGTGTFSLVKNGQAVSSDYLSVTRSNASPANAWYAGTHSTNGGTNSGWTFTEPLGKYWVGGTGSWSDNTNHWSTMSGGPPGAALPTASDNVFFDAGSNTSNAAYTVTVDSSAVMKDLNFSAKPGDGAGGTITWAGSSAMAISGSMTLLSGMTRSYAGNITFNATTTGKTITMNGVALSASLSFNGIGGSWVLQDTLNYGNSNLSLTTGALNTNGKTVNGGSFTSQGAGARTLTLGSTAMNFTTNGDLWNVDSGLVLTPNSSTITFNGTTGFTGGGLSTYNNVVINNYGGSISGANTFANLTITSNAKTNSLTLSANQTVTGTLTINGNSVINRLLVQSNTVGTARTITAANVSISNADFMDITGAGAAAPFTGTSLGNALGNSGITFTAPVTRYAVFAVDKNYSDTSMWSDSSGGATGVSVPLPQDTVIFDRNSATAANKKISLDMPRMGKDFDFSDAANGAYDYTLGNDAGVGVSIYGSWIGDPAHFNWTGTNGFTFSGRSSHTLRSAGKAFTQGLFIDMPGGTLILEDALTTSASAILYLMSGTLNANNQNVTTDSFSSSNSNTRALTMGSGTWTLTTGSSMFWNTNTTTNFTLNPDSSTIKLTGTLTADQFFQTGTITLNNFWNATGGAYAVKINNNTTFNNFKVNPGRIVLFIPNMTVTINSLTAIGTAGNLITLDTTTGTGSFNLVKNGPVARADYLSVTRSNASPANTWYAGTHSTNGGTNSGWIFTDPVGKYWVGGTGNWSDATNHWATSTGGVPAADNLPTASDNVFFDINSNATDYTMTIDATANCNDMVWENPASGNPTMAGTSALNIYGSLVMAPGMTSSWNASLTFLATTAGETLTFNGVEMGGNPTAFNGTGSWKMLDDWTDNGNVMIEKGTFNTNGKTLTRDNYTGLSINSNTEVRSLILGSSVLNIRRFVGPANATNFTFNPGTSVIKMLTVGTTFDGAGLTFNDVEFYNSSGSNAYTVTGSNTFNNLTITGSNSKTSWFALSANQTVTGTLTINGHSVINRLLVQSNTIGTPRTITAANVSVTNTDFQDITAAGAGNWNLSAISGGSGNAGGNTGITFTPAATQYFKAGTSQNWSTAGNWYLATNGGGGAGRVPLPQDTARFDANSITAGGATITQDMPRIGSVDWTGVTNTPTFTMSTTASVFGSMTLVPAMNLSGSSDYTFEGRGSYMLTSAGKTFAQTLIVRMPGGTLTLVDALTASGAFSHSNGTFVDAGNNVTISMYDANYTGTHALTKTGNWVLTSTLATNLWIPSSTQTISDTAGYIKFSTNTANTQGFVGRGFTYHDLWLASATANIYQITGSNTFNDIKLNEGTAAHSLTFDPSSVTTVNTFTVSGTNGNLVTLDTTGGTGTFTLVKNEGPVVRSDYLSVTRSTASPANTWYAGTHSTNGGTNSGWTFTDPLGKYWVGGTGNWSDATNHWATSTGGAPAAENLPTASDNVFFDAGSNTSNAAYTVTVDSSAVMKDLNFSAKPGDGAGGTITWAGSSAMAISGSMTLLSGMTRSYAGNITFNATTTGKTITMNGVALSASLSFNGIGGSWVLQDTLNYGNSDLSLTTGALNTNGKTVNGGSFNSRGAGARTLTLGSTAMNFTTNGDLWNVDSGLVLTPNSSTITFNGITNFTGGGLSTYNNIVINTNSYNSYIAGANTFANLTITGNGSKTGLFTLYANQTVTGTLSINGNSATNRVLVQSNTIGTPRTITAANVSVTNTDFQDITGAGAGNWDLSAISGGSGNAGGNTGITFTPAGTQYFKAGTSQNWSTAGNWYLATNGGGGAGRVPLPQDTARFDANSITAGSVTITQDMPRIGSVDWTGVTNTPTWTTNTVASVFGSITLVSGMTLTDSNETYTMAGRGANTMTNAGKIWNKSFTIDCVIGSVTIVDSLRNLNYASILTLTSGALIVANGSNITFDKFASSGTSARSLSMGSGTWTIVDSSAPWDTGTVTNFAFNADTSTLKISGVATGAGAIFSGGGLVYNNFWNSTAGTQSVIITGSNTFNDFKIDAGRTQLFAAGTTQTVNTFTATGTAGNLVTLDTTGGTGTFTLIKNEGPVVRSDYLSVTRSNASPADTWYAGTHSTNGGTNSGWAFTDPVGRYWVGGTGNWSDNTNHWSDTSGGAPGASLPTASDNVYFDSNSSATSYTVTFDVESNCADMIWGNPASGSPTMAGISNTNVYGNLYFVAGMTTKGGWLRMSAASGTKTITSNGVVSNFSFHIGGGSGAIFQLANDMIYAGSWVWLTGGSFSTNGKTFTSVGENIYLQGNFSGSNAFYNLTRTGTNTKINTLRLFGNIEVTNNLTINGNSVTNRVLVQSDTVGTARTITAANVSISNADFQDITAAGAGNWNLSAISGGSGNAGGNTGITFTPAATQYFKAGTSQNWSTAGNWYLATNGGGGAGRVPLPQDTARFDANSITAGGATITQDMPRIGSVDWTGVTNTPTFTMSTTASVFGSMTLVPAMNLSGSSDYTFEGRGSYTLTTAGLTLDKSITLAAPGGTLALGGALTMGATRVLTLNNGTLNASNYAVSTGYFSSSNSNTRALAMSGVWTLTGSVVSAIWNLQISAGMALTASGSTIKTVNYSSASRQFLGGGLVYGNLEFAGTTASLYISGSNTFNDIKLDEGTVPHTLMFEDAKTTTVNNFTVSGTEGNLVTLLGTSNGYWSIVKNGSPVALDYLSISRSNASPANTWYAGINSINGGGNSGWGFIERRYWVGGSGNWSDAANHWATSTGGLPGAANLPTATSSVIFNSASNADAYTVTIDSAAACDDLTIGNPASGVVTFAGSAALAISGSAEFAAGMTNNYTGAITFNSNFTGKIITMNGVSLASAITFNGVGGGWQLADALSTTGAITLTNGTLDTNSQSVGSLTFATAAGTKTLNLGSTTWTLTGNDATIWGWSVTNAIMFGHAGTIVSNYSGGTGTRTITMGQAESNPSLSVTAGTDIVITSAAYLGSLSFSGFSGTWSSSSGALSVKGDFILGSGMTNNNTAAMTFTAASAKSLSTQSNSVKGIAFNSDGTKMYIIGGSTVYQYTLSTPWDVLTASLATSSPTVSAQDSSPYGLTFNPDGTKMYVLGRSNGTVYQYTLGTAWDVSTANYASLSKSVAAQSTTPYASTFNSDGTKMYIADYNNGRIFQYTLSSAWDVSTASYASLTISLSPGWNTTGVAFNSDGTKMYVLGNNFTAVYEYTLGTAWNVSTATYDSLFRNVKMQDNSTYGVTFSSDGTKMYVTGDTNDAVYQYTLGTAWDVSTANVDVVEKTITSNGVSLGSTLTFNGVGGSWQLADALSTAGSILLNNGTLDTNSQSVSSLIFGLNGNSMKILNLGASVWTLTGNNGIIWNWATTNTTMIGNMATIVANYSGSSGTRTFSTGSDISNPSLSITAGTDTVSISAGYLNNLNFTGFSGTWSSGSGALSLYGNLTLSAGMTNNNTAAITFAATSGKSFTTWESAPDSVTFNSDGTKMYMQGWGSDNVVEFVLGTAWDVSTAAYTSSIKNVVAQYEFIYGITFKPDGTKMYLSGDAAVYQYNLGTAWDVSTAVYLISTSTAAQDILAADIVFNSDGTKMYIMGWSSKKVYQYTLSTPWDISTAAYTSLFISVNAQDSQPYGLALNSDGSKMYMSGTANDTIYQYTLSTPWNVSTASYLVSKSVAAQETSPQGVTFNSDGTKMYIVGMVNDTVYQYTLGTPWDVSTANLSTNAKTITSNNVTLGSAITFNGVGGNWTLADDLTATGTALTLTNGTFNHNNKTVSLTGAGTVAITGDFSFYNLTRTGTASANDALTFSTSTTITNLLTLTGNSSANKITVRSSATGSQKVITAGSVSLSDARFKDIDANGAAIPWTGSRLIDLGNNLDINFDAIVSKYWVNGTGNWSDAANHWSDSSGGSPGAGNLPSADDHVIFNSASNADAYTVTIDSAVACNDFTLGNPASGVITLAGSAALAIFGSAEFANGMTNDYTGAITFSSYNTGKIITMNGTSLASTVTFDGAGGGWQLQDALSTNGVVTLTNGALDTNSQSVSSLTFATATGYKTLNMGSSSWTLTGNNTSVWNWVVTNATMIGNMATIVSNYSGSTGTRLFSMSSDVSNPSLSITAGTDSVNTQGSIMNNLNFTGFSGTWSSSSGGLALNGNLTLGAGMTNSNTAALTFAATSVKNVGAQYGVTFNLDGTKMYVVGFSDDTVYQYSLSSAWNVFTAYSTSLSKSVTTEDNQPFDVAFNSDGTKMYVIGYGSDSVYQYTLGTAWDVSTASYASLSKSVTAEDNQPMSLAFNSDGTKMFIMGNYNKSVYQYTLGTAWDVSTASYASLSKSVVAQDSGPNDVAFSPDGYKMYIMGNTNDTVYQYTLGTAWDVSTASYASLSKSVVAQNIETRNVVFNSGGTKMYIMGYSNYDGVYQYNLGTPWDVSTADVITNPKTITSNGKALASAVTFSGVGGSWTLADDFTTTGDITIAKGILIDAGKTVTVNTFINNGSAGRGLTKTGNWILTGFSSTPWNSSQSGFTLSDTAGYIKFAANNSNSMTFAGGGYTYNDLWFASATSNTYTITGANTFHEIRLNEGTAAHTIVFPNATTTVESFNVRGTPGKLVTLERTGVSGIFGLYKSSVGNVSTNYISVSNSIAASANNFWFAGADSINGGNNSGWIFETMSDQKTMIHGTIKVRGNVKMK